MAAAGFPDPIKLVASTPAPLVQRCHRDSKTTFPQPTEEAIDAGVIDESDCQPDNLKSLHENYTGQLIATLRAIDAVLDAPTGHRPRDGQGAERRSASKERLRKYLKEEPERLEHTYRILIETYENAFGPEAAQAFSKAIRAWHAGIEVVADTAPPSRQPDTPTTSRVRRVVATLPVPRPLPAAVTAGHFGREANGKPVNPSAAEVRAITEIHAERIIDLLHGLKEVERSLASSQCGDRARLEAESNRLQETVRAAVELYAGSFGQEPAARLRHMPDAMCWCAEDASTASMPPRWLTGLSSVHTLSWPPSPSVPAALTRCAMLNCGMSKIESNASEALKEKFTKLLNRKGVTEGAIQNFMETHSELIPTPSCWGMTFTWASSSQN